MLYVIQKVSEIQKKKPSEWDTDLTARQSGGWLLRHNGVRLTGDGHQLELAARIRNQIGLR
jgi:hypothetical protein